ncbi:hypothetical protein ElyMa_002348800 [Elysia marginata]|uniref:Uncharacterized protein n=1 Tax=Elysia marginata TaxID=1093978 RepID=A0AAV4G8N9_9GAST|nr:hypothetical protein ElyMa_002348800 [Elysia marginata]
MEGRVEPSPFSPHGGCYLYWTCLSCPLRLESHTSHNSGPGARGLVAQMWEMSIQQNYERRKAYLSNYNDGDGGGGNGSQWSAASSIVVVVVVVVVEVVETQLSLTLSHQRPERWKIKGDLDLTCSLPGVHTSPARPHKQTDTLIAGA